MLTFQFIDRSFCRWSNFAFSFQGGSKCSGTSCTLYATGPFAVCISSFGYIYLRIQDPARVSLCV